MKIVKLSVGDVEIIEQLTWGQQEQIRDAMLGGVSVQGLSDAEKKKIELNASVISKAKYKALEIAVKKITLSDGNQVPYSKEWMDNLSIDDGDKLFAAVNEITNPKKK